MSRDKDQDTFSSGNCAEKYGGGWWWPACGYARPMGRQGDTSSIFFIFCHILNDCSVPCWVVSGK